MFKNKKVLITGGTGSFGKAVLDRFLKSSVNEIRIFSRDEKKQEDLRLKLNNPKLNFFIGDVRNYNSIFYALKDIDYVFHAAALKQVPSCEFYPMEAYLTNVIGTENVINASIENHIKKLVLLSTDKAVYPINAMGISKAMAEKVLLSRARMMNNENDTILCATRYGNVIASRGSVIPLFISQLKSKKPMTLTDPKMTRFLMSLEESVDLVFYALNKAQQGDIFVQKSPASNIFNISQAIAEILSKEKPDIKIIGTRHGEKLYETLLTREELLRSKETKRYYIIKTDNRDLNYSKYFIKGEKSISLIKDYTSHSTNQLNTNELKRYFQNVKEIKEFV